MIDRAQNAVPVACVMLAPGLGGLEQSLIDYCEALLLEGHPVHAVIDPRWAGRRALERLPLATILPLANCGEWDPLAVHRLRRWLRAAAPPLVLTIGRRASTIVRRARRPRPLPLQVGVTPNYSLGPLIGLDHVLATTSDLRNALIAAGQPPARITVVPNLVRVPPEGTPATADPGRVPVIGALGRFVSRKGFADLIVALARLRARGYRFEARLAGSGPEDAALRALAGRLGIEDRLRFLGWITDQRSFFEALDLLCVPSREEPFGIVVLEGMAHARATLSYWTSSILILGFLALYSSTAITAPFRGGITIAAFSPVRSPMNPILTEVTSPPASPPPPPPAQAASTSDEAAASARTRPSRAPDTGIPPMTPTIPPVGGALTRGRGLGRERSFS
jgi:glycosyltransferase involved in cell wall biosynthesis